ncbi:hypothetical protein GC207_11280 [bacterium]|nr:hypothetical protein [bacterium]
MPNKVDILIQINSELAKLQSTLAGFKSLVNEGKNAAKTTADNTTATNSWIQALKTGLGINFTSIMLRGLREVLGVMEDIVHTSVSFNKQMETSRLGIAAILRSMNPDRVTDFNQALKISDALLEQLKVKSLESAATYGELVELFQSTTAAQSRAGIPLNQQVQLALDLANAVRAVGLEGRQLTQESRDLLTGNIGPDSFLAKSLGITREDVLTAQREGRLFDFLETKLTGFKEATDAAKESYAVLWSNLKQSFDIQAGHAGKGFFGELETTFKELTKLVNSPGFVEGMGKLFKLAQMATQVGNAGIRHADTIASLAKRFAMAALSPRNQLLAAMAGKMWDAIPVDQQSNNAGDVPGGAEKKAPVGVDRATQNALAYRSMRSNEAGLTSEGLIQQLEREKDQLQIIQADIGQKFEHVFMPDGETYTKAFAEVADQWFDLKDKIDQTEQDITEIKRREAEKRKKIRENELELAIQGLSGFAEASKAFGAKGFVAYKALAVSEAIISTYLAASRALGENPTGLNYIAAAGVTAAGLANVATIASQNYGGYKAGDYTGDGDPNQVAGVVHKREFVFTDQQTARIGVNNLRALASGKAAAMPAVAAPSAQKISIGLLDDRNAMINWARSAEGERVIVETIRKNRTAIGIPAA